MEDFYSETDTFNAKKVFLPKSFAKRDILNPTTCYPFFSDRIMKAFEEEGVIGCDVVKEGLFQEIVLFE